MAEDMQERFAQAKRQLAWALKSQDNKRIAAILDLAKTEPGIAVTPDVFDRDPWLLNCPNGTLELRTGTLREHRRSDYITKLCPTIYDPAACSPTWDRFLLEIFAGDYDLIDYLKRLAGYFLTGDTSEHMLPVFHGSGANGKSVLVNTLMFVLGEDYASAASPDLLTVRHGERHPTEIANLFGKRLLVCQETAQGKRLNEPLVKWLTGGDKLQARRMREDMWEFTPTHKAVLVTNHKPAVSGTDNGIWRRLRLVPFDVTFPEDKQDRNLPEKLRAEASGILTWAVRGCAEWLVNGTLPPPKVLAATADYRNEEDVLEQFLADCCLRGPAYSIRAGDLYDSFAAWQGRVGEAKIQSQKAFGAAMTAKGFARKPNNGTWYVGVALRG